MILQNGVAFSHSDEADFEFELAFERRVIDYARPRLAAAVQQRLEPDGRQFDPAPIRHGRSPG